jgi:hypothetical protein
MVMDAVSVVLLTIVAMVVWGIVLPLEIARLSARSPSRAAK